MTGATFGRRHASMSDANQPEPPANARALSSAPATKDLHWTQKRRPQTAASAIPPAWRRRVRAAVQNTAAAVQRTPAPAAGTTLATPLAPENTLRADRVGRLKLGSGLETLPTPVRKGQLLGEVEALSLRWPVQAPADGVVLAVLGSEGGVVEYAQPLFQFEPAANARRCDAAA